MFMLLRVIMCCYCVVHNIIGADGRGAVRAAARPAYRTLVCFSGLITNDD